MNHETSFKKYAFHRHLSSVFFGSRKAAVITSLFCLAIAALLYIAYLQVQEAEHVELPAGRVERTDPTAAHVRATASQEILILNSYHAGHTWSDNEMAGITNLLHETAPGVTYSMEYLDCKRHPGHEHFEALQELFKIKYGHRVIPIVIVADNPALEFALTYRARLFPRSAIVFCGVNNVTTEMLAGQKNITGLAEALAALDTVKLALRLNPATKTVVVVHDYTSTGLATRRETEQQVQEMSGRVSFRYLEDLTRNELISQLKGLPKDSIVLALAYSVFKDGELIGHEDLAGFLSANAPVPVYGVHRERLGYGIVGGSLLSGKLHGAEAGRVALTILSGTPASDIPVELKPATRIMVDYNQLLRFRIPVKAVPAGGVVVNRPIPFISSHLYLVVSTLLVIGMLCSGIVILGFAIYRRELVENDLRNAKAELESRVAERTAELKSTNEQLYVELTERKKAEEELGRLNQELDQRVRERTAELSRKNAALETMNKSFVGRELRMVELKQRIKALENESHTR
ncbi:MAG: hypothetical protein M0T70_10855 [Geobacteraceae bacterium]|nr:hypothetical protein [Geobacteraceae bacterium]